jgi:NAD-dependent deacetylase
LPVTATEQGAKLVIINKEPTPLDPIADLVFYSAASEVLEGAI